MTASDWLFHKKIWHGNESGILYDVWNEIACRVANPLDRFGGSGAVSCEHECSAKGFHYQAHLLSRLIQCTLVLMYI